MLATHNSKKIFTNQPPHLVPQQQTLSSSVGRYMQYQTSQPVDKLEVAEKSKRSTQKVQKIDFVVK